MNSKAQIEAILKQRFFVTPTGYPSQNGFLDYGPPLAQIKLQILAEFRRIFVDETTYEIEPSAVLPYEVLKNSGHIDKFCDVILTDGSSIVRADHFLEDTVGEEVPIPLGLKENYATTMEKLDALKKEVIINSNAAILAKSKLNDVSKNVASIGISADKSAEQFSASEVAGILSHFEYEVKNLADLSKLEIDFVVAANNLHSAEGKPFNPSKDYNLIFKLNDSQYLRPEIAQSQFTNFKKILDLNNEKLPFSTLAIGRSYRNEISARGGMLRTKEFEQAEIEYFTEDGAHEGFRSVSGVEVYLVPNDKFSPCTMTLADAIRRGIISSEAICYFIAKAQEFLLAIGFQLSSIRYRQHKKNEMAHYASDCWDVEIKTMSGWVECAGIADRGTFDLTCHSKEINASVRKHVAPKTIYEPAISRQELGKALRGKFKELEEKILGLTQEEILLRKKDNSIDVEFEGTVYSIPLTPRTVDCEFFIPRVIEPSFGISRILYSLVEQGFKIRDGRHLLSIKPRLCYLHCMITYLKYMDDFAPLVDAMKAGFKKNAIRYQTNDRTCSIGKKYSSCDEIGIPYFITFDFESQRSRTVTIRDRDTTTQIRVPCADVPNIIKRLLDEELSWNALFEEHETRCRAADQQ